MNREDGSTSPDSATVEVVRNFLVSAADESQRTLVRTAYTILYDILGFGISLYDWEYNLLPDSPRLALFLGSNDYAVENTIENLSEEKGGRGHNQLLISGPAVVEACFEDIFDPKQRALKARLQNYLTGLGCDRLRRQRLRFRDCGGAAHGNDARPVYPQRDALQPSRWRRSLR